MLVCQKERVCRQNMEIDLSLPYVTHDLQGVGGQLRVSADHFLVEELLLYEPEGKGQHLYVNLTKEGLTTKEVQQKLATLFGLQTGDVGFAGLKDKHARSSQTFSLMITNVDNDLIDRAKKHIEDSLPVTVNWTRLHRNKLKPGHLLGNRFIIKITGLTLVQTEALQRAREIARRLKERGLPNFFGPQRFGFDGDNVRRGHAIILGKKDGVDRWLRYFFISSYQSYLCNRYLIRRLELGAFDRLLTGDIAKKHATGGLFQVEDVGKEQPRYERREISFTAPMYGTKMWAAIGPSGELETETLMKAGLTIEQFELLGIRGTRRMGRLLVPDLTTDLDPQGLLVRFSLPKGAFATTVLREIMKTDAQTHEIQ